MGDLRLRATPTPQRQQYLREGYWDDRSLGTYLDDHLTRLNHRSLRIWSSTRPWIGSFAEVQQLGQQIAGGLAAQGIGPGDVVAFQLPNCVEAVAAFHGVTLLGATLVPVVHFYGPKELGWILRQSDAKAFITADRFGTLDYLDQLDKLKPTLPDLAVTVVVEMDDPSPSLGGLERSDRLNEPTAVDPDSPALIAYTSGTTADPKGVVHTHRSIGAEGRQLGSIQPRPNRALLNGAPIGHAIGMLAGILIPLELDNDIHLTDSWDPSSILSAMLDADIYAGSGATFFLQSLLDHPDCSQAHIDKMRFIGLGGAAVPVAFAERATDLGISLMRSYGSTEHPSTSGASHDDDAYKRIHTDGHPLSGVEVLMVDDAGEPVPDGHEGEIWSRGPDLAGGYTDPTLTAESFTADGWYRTGDIGVRDADGWLTITDRKKDIIIRGGETISPAEVESVLVHHPAIAEAAMVGVPDVRMGERGRAYLRLSPGAAEPDLESIRDHLREQGLARQKWPEEIEVVLDFPRTPSGKILKRNLR